MEAAAEKKKDIAAINNENVWWDTDLDEEEQWIEDHLDEFVPSPKWVGESLHEAANHPPVVIHENDIKKPVSMRLGQHDLDQLKILASKQGLQYQSLIGSILHRYVMGTLVDISEVKKVLTVK